MKGENPVEWIVLICFVVSLALSVWVASLKLKLWVFDRFSSFASQVAIAAISLLPILHGSPNEWFDVLVLVICWSVFAIISTWRLYHLKIMPVKMLAFTQLIQIIGNLLLGLVNYADACYAWSGHFIWNP